MTEKRFENRLNKDKKYFNALNPVWDNWQGTALSVFEMIDLLNEQSDELVEYCNFSLHDLLDKKNKEIEQLRQVMGFMQNDNANDILGVLNSRERIFEQLRNENKQLLKEKEDWKGTCITASNENSILWNEIHILMEQGAEPSQSFKEYLESVSTEYDKFWQRKLKKAKESKVV